MNVYKMLYFTIFRIISQVWPRFFNLKNPLCLTRWKSYKEEENSFSKRFLDWQIIKKLTELRQFLGEATAKFNWLTSKLIK